MRICRFGEKLGVARAMPRGITRPAQMKLKAKCGRLGIRLACARGCNPLEKYKTRKSALRRPAS